MKSALPPPGLFTLAAELSPSDAYRRIDGDLPEPVIGSGRERAVISPVEPGDTLHLWFHGVGAAGECASARLWGLEPRGRGYDGRHLADFVLRLGGDEYPDGGFCRRAPARIVNDVETPFEATPFPGIISRWKHGHVNMVELMLGVWDYTAYIVEITMRAPRGLPTMQAAGALWAAYTHPKPKTDAELRKAHEEFMQQLRDSGVEFRTPDEDQDESKEK